MNNTPAIINDSIEEDMIRRKEQFEREARAKLSTKQWYGGIDFLMKRGVATADDWGVVRQNVGSSTAMRTALGMGFPVDEDNNKDIRN